MASSAQSGAAGPRPINPSVHTPGHDQAERKDLASWWRAFKRSDKKAPEQQAPAGIFGIPLQQSIRYANVAISLFNDDGQSYIYGYVPIVVAKCGVYLKEKATDVEGIFRLAGSEKRIKELKVAFDSPDRYGKGLDWTGYTVHDAANILRRYFNQLPEPIIPLEFYDRFRDPLRNHQAQAVGIIDTQSPSVGDFDINAAIRAYQALITELPPLNRQLLLYILDLLAVFASKSDLNKMTTPNLAAIFQPGILSHPQHDMAPQEYRLSQDVLIFLIENQDSFLIGMQGTAADAETVRDVQSGTPAKSPGTPTTPTRAKTVIGRSASTASAGAESIRKYGNVRRNVSVSSKHSKRSELGPTPITPIISNPSTPTSGVHRSNTVPSRRLGSAAHSPRFPRDKGSDPPTPSPGMLSSGGATSSQGSMQSTPIASTAPTFPAVAPPAIHSASSSEATTPVATIGSDNSSAITRDYVTPKKDTTPLLAPLAGAGQQRTERSVSGTPSTSSGRAFLDIFKQSPPNEADVQRKPNKLQKKRIPGSALSSAQSSSQSLHEDVRDAAIDQRSPTTPVFPAAAASETQAGRVGDQSVYATAQTTPTHPAPQRNPTDATLRPTTSPTHSYRSTDMSDAEMVGDDLPQASDSPSKEKKKQRRWRFSRSQNKMETPTPGNATGNPLGTMNPREQAASRSTIGSTVGSSGQRRSFQESTPLAPSTLEQFGPPNPVSSSTVPAPAPQTLSHPQPAATEPVVFSDSEREKKGPMSWIRGKIQERKEKSDAEKRAKTPERHRERHHRGESRPDLRLGSDAVPVRGKSFEVHRAANGNDGAANAIAEVPAASQPTATYPAEAAHGSATDTAPSTTATNGQPSTAAQ